MKRSIIWILVLALSFGLCGCAEETTKDEKVPETTLSDAQLYSVPNPMQYPTYTFDHTPTTDELRQMAVKAMNDMLSIQWCTPKFISYQKTGAVSEKHFSYVPEINLCGLPYTNGDSAIFNFFEYYDTTTGQMDFPGDGDDFNKVIGNTCTGSIMWAWSTVCDSLTGIYDNYHMTYLNKCYPVGDYITPNSVDSYNQYGTDQICLDNGKEVILESYGKCLPADGLSSSPKNHGMMVISPAVVVRNADGTINGDESYIYIIDQGQSWRTATNEAGDTAQMKNSVDRQMTFMELYDNSYIPFTFAEFLGTDSVDETQCSIELTGDTVTSAQLFKAKVTANYGISDIYVSLKDDSGKEVYRLATRATVSGVRELAITKNGTNTFVTGSKYDDLSGSYAVEVSVQLSTGERPVVYTGTVTIEN